MQAWKKLRDRSPKSNTGFVRLFSAIDKVNNAVENAESLTKIANRQVFAEEALNKTYLGDLKANLKFSYSQGRGCPEAGDSFDLQFISTETLTSRAAMQRFLADSADPRSQRMLRAVVEAYTLCLDVSKTSIRLSVDGQSNVAVVKQDQARRWEAQFNANTAVAAAQIGYLTPAQARLDRIMKLRAPDATGIGYRFEACDGAVGTRRSRSAINSRDICEAYWDADIRPTSALRTGDGFILDDAQVAQMCQLISGENKRPKSDRRAWVHCPIGGQRPQIFVFDETARRWIVESSALKGYRDRLESEARIAEAVRQRREEEEAQRRRCELSANPTGLLPDSEAQPAFQHCMEMAPPRR
jgi:hypothetical protein